MNTIWVRTAWLLLAIAGVVFAPLASAYGMRWGLAAVVVCLLLMLAWHLVHLHLLMRWLEGPLDAPLPRGRGAWERHPCPFDFSPS